MKTIVAGSRDITNIEFVRQAISRAPWVVSEVVSGAARGVDTLGEMVAKERGVAIKRFPADWDSLGRRAGPLRNIQMADYADALIAVWDGVSRGTAHMIKEAEKRGLKVFVFNPAVDATLVTKEKSSRPRFDKF